LIGINNFPLFCDGYFKDFNLIIETDGVHHKKPVWKFGGYERFEIQQQNDKLKDQLTKENGIKLIRIDIDSDWHDINYLKKVLIENGIELTQLSHNAS
jgi:very-short-patch-repair endonuclease